MSEWHTGRDELGFIVHMGGLERQIPTSLVYFLVLDIAVVLELVSFLFFFYFGASYSVTCLPGSSVETILRPVPIFFHPSRYPSSNTSHGNRSRFIPSLAMILLRTNSKSDEHAIDVLSQLLLVSLSVTIPVALALEDTCCAYDRRPSYSPWPDPCFRLAQRQPGSRLRRGVASAAGSSTLVITLPLPLPLPSNVKTVSSML